jgi:predicted DNA-binding protein (MmcQ/YjbR family)
MALALDDIRTYCRRKPGHVTEGMPFGDDVLVFKVKGKIFLLASLVRHPLQINLKADPEQAVEWRERFDGVTPGYHMNKRHWNTVLLDGSVPAVEVYRMIDHSYDLVAATTERRRSPRGTTTGPRTMARLPSGGRRGRQRP